MLLLLTSLAVALSTFKVAEQNTPVVARSSNGLLDVTLVYGLMVIDFGNGTRFTGRVYNNSVPGPTLQVYPGDRLRIKVMNVMEDSHTGATLLNTYRMPNFTNLHTHGLHVSPIAPADDVSVVIPPGGSYQYEYDIPINHSPAVHWYHPHVHGSAALQVFSQGYGLIEVLSPNPVVDEGYPATIPSVTMAVSYLDFSGRDAALLSEARIQTIAAASKDDIVLRDVALGVLPTEDTWLVNGRIAPSYIISTAVNTRFRMVFCSAGSELTLSLTHKKGTCGRCSVRLMARDGHQLHRYPRTIDGFIYVPTGGRADLLVYCEKEAVRDVECEETPYLLESHNRTVTLAKIFKSNKGIVEEPVHPLSLIGKRVSYAQDLTEVEVDPKNIVHVELMDPGFKGCRYNTISPMKGQIDAWYHEGDDTRHAINLGDVMELHLNGSSLHPFHMHVQPYQIVGGRTYAAQGNFETGDFVDSAMFQDLVLRLKPVTFAGPQMFHCHVLSHEDQGCMAQFMINDARKNRGVETVGSDIDHSNPVQSIDRPTPGLHITGHGSSLATLIIAMLILVGLCLFYTFNVRI